MDQKGSDLEVVLCNLGWEMSKATKESLKKISGKDIIEALEENPEDAKEYFQKRMAVPPTKFQRFADILNEAKWKPTAGKEKGKAVIKEGNPSTQEPSSTVSTPGKDLNTTDLGKRKFNEVDSSENGYKAWNKEKVNEFFDTIFQEDDDDWQNNSALKALKKMNFRGASLSEVTFSHLQSGGLEVGDALFVLGKIKGLTKSDQKKHVKMELKKEPRTQYSAYAADEISYENLPTEVQNQLDTMWDIFRPKASKKEITHEEFDAFIAKNEKTINEITRKQPRFPVLKSFKIRAKSYLQHRSLPSVSVASIDLTGEASESKNLPNKESTDLAKKLTEETPKSSPQNRISGSSSLSTLSPSVTKYAGSPNSVKPSDKSTPPKNATQLKQVVFTYMKTKGILKEGETPNPSHYQTLVSKLYSIGDKQEAYESWKSQRSPIDIMLDLATEIQLLDAPWNL